MESGLVETLGNRRGGNHLPSSSCGPRPYAAQLSLVAACQEKVFHQCSFIQFKDSISLPFPLVTLLHISAPRAYRLLRRLQEEGKLALHGKSGRI